MSNETNAPAPEMPAASLLFQAPTFQAPTFQAPPQAPVQDEDEARSARKRKAKTIPTQATVEVAEESQDEAPKTRTRKSRKKDPVAEETQTRRTRTRKTHANSEDAGDEAHDSGAHTGEEGNSEEETVQETPGEPSSENGRSAEDEEEGTSRRRRRRRTRSTSTEDAEDLDPADQVKALKGSTRLEAKKMRRREGRKEGRRRHGITESEFLARRESVNRTMVIRHHDGLDQIAILEDDLLVEHYVARRTHTSMVGNIYMGRVQNVLPSMEAAFIDIGRGRNAVLYAGEVNWDAVGLEGRPRRIESALKSGDPVLVQVTKDPIGHKGARLTSQITLAGRYLVLIPGGSMMGISRKLPDKERTRLKRILKKVVPADSGVIVRTAAEGASEAQISDDVARLTKQWSDIETKRAKAKSAPVLLRGEPELAVRVVRDIFNEDFSSLVIQGRDTYHTVKEYVEELSPELSERVEQWVSTEDVFSAHRIDEQLAKGMDRKVWLPSGGTLVIDRTEAMTVVDVNTGKFIGAGGTLEETVTRNNLEAAEEIVRQLRLRDIGGIVIIDFVDMVLESNRDLVLRRLVECLGRDRTRHQVTEITSLGLVQMTRKRVGEGLVEAFSTTCSTCEGRGFIVHQHPVESSGGGGEKSASSKAARKKAEPRRIDEGPGRERAREAVSAIAAASHHKDEEAPKLAEVEDDEPISGVHSAKVEAPVVADLSAKPAKARRTRASSAVQAPAAEPGAVPVAQASVLLIDEGEADAQTTPGNASQTPAKPTVTVEAPSTVDAPVKRARRTRRAVSTASAEPAASTPLALDLPAPVAAPPSTMGTEIRTETPKVDPLASIVLPERSEAAPRTKRRRRAVSTGVVSTGEEA